MNKKITPRIIKIIAFEAVFVMVAVTVLGAAIIKHKEYQAMIGSTTPPAVQEQSTQGGDLTGEPTDETTDNVTDIGTTVPTTPAAPVEDDRKFPYAYAGFVPQITDVNADLSEFIVNGNYCLPPDYNPTLAEAVPGSGVYLDYRVAPYYQQMYDAALADGIVLKPISGYRSYATQKKNFENLIAENMEKGMSKADATREAATVIMVPGSSEHNAGLAMDICSLAQSFENYDEFKWLDEHAAEYGFILRYPKDEESKAITGVIYEPWHYRFVGVETAKEIKARGITLEEYLGLA